MKKLVKINLLLLIIFVLSPYLIAYLVSHSYFGGVDIVEPVVVYSSLLLILFAGLYLLRYNFLFLKRNPAEKKTAPVIFLIISITPILYSLLLLYILFATRNGIGF